jgi:hypothetical protein
LQEQDEARQHIVNALAAAVRDGDHELAAKIHKHLRDEDSADQDDDEEEEALEGETPTVGDFDQSQSGRREGPEHPYGSQTGQKGMYSPGGKGNMESRYAAHRQAGGGYIPLTEGRKPSKRKVATWAGRLLRD